LLSRFFLFRVINKDYNEEQGLEKEAIMLTYIWIESWSLRQALRFTLNGYDYVMVGKMMVLSVREIKYKRKQ
jgi:hypothetical protein